VNRKLEVLVAGDGSEICEFVASLLRPEFEVVGVAITGRDLVYMALDLMPDVIVLDTTLPTLGGITAMNELHATGTHIPVVLISGIFRRVGISRFPGARVYVDKSDLESDLTQAVQCAKSGKPFISRSIALFPPK
jgi:CheY-like chemotaxis protein